MRPIYLYFPIILVSYLLGVKYDYAISEWILLLFTTIFSFNFFRRCRNIKDNVNILSVIIYIFCSVHIMALFELTSWGFVKNVIYPNEYKALALWGNHLFFVLFSSYILVYRIHRIISSHKKISKLEPGNHKRRINTDSLFFGITVFIYLLSFISIITGISSLMSEASVILPFHLNGLIDEVRGNIYPFIFAVYLYDVLKDGRKMPTRNVLLFIGYAILEVILRQSKSALLWSFLPALVLAFFTGSVNKRILLKYVMPVFVVFIISYPIIETLRQTGGDFSLSGVQKAAQTSQSKDKDEKSSPYIRTFLTGMYYVKLVDVINPDNLSFDFRRVPVLLLMGGGVNYMTYEIDGFKEGDGVTVGVTGLDDALLWGGYMLCWILVLFLVFFAYYSDHGQYVRERPIYKLILFFLLFIFLTSRSITLLTDHVVLATVMNLVMKILIARYYYKRIY